MLLDKQVSLIDAHVHIHDCFDLSVFLDSAYDNLKKAALQLKKENAFAGVLLLAETSKAHWFQCLKKMTESDKNVSCPVAGDWRFDCTKEACSIIASRSDHEELIIVAGRQIVTGEKLEVLALGTEEFFQNGAPIRELMEIVWNAGAISVLPWGFGKWMGRRGSIVKSLLEEDEAPNFFLGDNGGRLQFFLYPKYFNLARSKGVRILPGSDPLPFPSEVWRPGSFGFVLRGAIDSATPTAHIKRLLADRNTTTSPYGRLENPYRFLKNQFAMQFKKSIRIE